MVWKGQFKKDYKRTKKQNRDIDKLRTVIELLAQRKPLPAKYRDHKLTGYSKEHRDCHIEPDWLLIYRFDGDDLILERTGSHSELFR
ncbi:MAG: type II toxin-antitoxin system YafQ family toxin [Planctomycetota bacterium]